MSILFKAERHDNQTIREKSLMILGKQLDLKEKYIEEIHKLLEKGCASKVPPKDMIELMVRYGAFQIIQLTTPRSQTRPELFLTVSQN